MTLNDVLFYTVSDSVLKKRKHCHCCYSDRWRTFVRTRKIISTKFRIKAVIASGVFNFLIFLVIVANTVILGSYSTEMSDETHVLFNEMDSYFLAFFTFEMCLKVGTTFA